MKEELGTPGAVVGMIFLGCLFVGLATAIYPGWPAVGAWMAEEDVPAWVQAVGSIAAIGVAIALQRHQQSLDRDIESRRERDHIAVAAVSVSNQLQALDDVLVLLTSERAVGRAMQKRENLQYWIDALNALPVPSNSDIDAVRLIDIECARSVAYVATQLLRLRSGLVLALHGSGFEAHLHRYVQIMKETRASSQHAQAILNAELQAHDDRRAADVK